MNAATVKQAWPMPHVDSEVHDFSGSACFAVLDFVSGYWQLPLHPESYGKCGVITPSGTYSSTRTLPGLTNATAHFQSTIEPLFKELRKNLKAWRDDFILHSHTEEELLRVLERFVEICAERELFLSAKKCLFFESELKWCGRTISGKGYRPDPARLEGLKDAHCPETGEELCQFIHCCRWMSLAIPNFAERIAPLSEVLEKAYAKSGRRTKRSIRSMELRNLSWGKMHEKKIFELQDR